MKLMYGIISLVYRQFKGQNANKLPSTAILYNLKWAHITMFTTLLVEEETRSK